MRDRSLIIYVTPSSVYSDAEAERCQRIIEAMAGNGLETEFLNPEGSPWFLDRSEEFDSVILEAERTLYTVIVSGKDRSAVVIAARAIDPGLATSEEAGACP